VDRDPAERPDTIVGTLADAFQSATGARLVDQQIVPLALWSQCANGSALTPPDVIAPLGRDQRRLSRVPILVPAPIDTLLVTRDRADLERPR
jgi:hypothetical protein